MTDSNSLEFTVPDPWGDLPGYALNALSPDERARVDALLESSPEARDELRRYMEAAENLSHLSGGTEPAEHVRKLLLAQVDSDIHLMGVARQEARSVLPPRTPILKMLLKPVRVAYAGTAAAIISIIAVSVIFGMENSRLNSEVDALRSDFESELAAVAELREALDETNAQFASQDTKVARLNAVNAGLNEALKNMQWLTYVTQNDEYRVLNYLVGGPQVPEANATLSVKKWDNLAVFLVSSLPPAPEGYQYMLSLVREGVPQSVATFQVNEAGMARVEFKTPGNIAYYESAIVSLERLDNDFDVISGPEVMTLSETQN